MIALELALEQNHCDYFLGKYLISKYFILSNFIQVLPRFFFTTHFIHFRGHLGVIQQLCGQEVLLQYIEDD